jgi:4-hydroxy-3-polyprenylbenzoate decarboxylase
MKLIVAITGASGSIYARRLLQLLAPTDCDISLTISPVATQVIERELGVRVDLDDLDAGAIAGVEIQVAYYRHDDFFAPFASGSARYDGMVIVPCSVGTLGRIAAGCADNLITRAADVSLKERRPLVLMVRETPLSGIHLANMKAISDAGGVIMPACPSFYSRPESIDELVDTVVVRALDHLGVAIESAGRWGSE